MQQKQLISARRLRDEIGLPEGSSYRLARLGLIPSYRVGPKLTGVRFIASEVLEALRQPAGSGEKPPPIAAKGD